METLPSSNEEISCCNSLPISYLFLDNRYLTQVLKFQKRTSERKVQWFILYEICSFRFDSNPLKYPESKLSKHDLCLYPPESMIQFQVFDCFSVNTEHLSLFKNGFRSYF